MLGAVRWTSHRPAQERRHHRLASPGDELKDQRVFGPLREGQKSSAQLGFVMSVAGNDVKVKRFTDDQVVTVARNTLGSVSSPRG